MLPSYPHRVLSWTAAVLLLAFSPPAFALDQIYSPNAEDGEFSFEYNGSRTFDKDSTKDNAQGHEFALEYGVNDRLVAEVSAGVAKDPGDNLKFESVEVEGRYQFFEPGQYWMDSGVLLAYGHSLLAHEPDSL